MEKVLNYIIESSIALGVLTMVYRFLLKRNYNLVFNRIFILSSLAFAAILPFIHFSLKTSGMPNLLPAIFFGEQELNILENITVYTERTNRMIMQSIQQISWMRAPIFGHPLFLILLYQKF